jgi:hypothetical protein
MCTQVSNDDCGLCESTSTFSKKTPLRVATSSNSAYSRRVSTRRSSSGLASKSTLSQLRESPLTTPSSSAVSTPADSPPSSPHSPFHNFSQHLGRENQGSNLSRSPEKGRRMSNASSHFTTAPPTSAPDSCANCCLSLPKDVNNKLQSQFGPTLRTRETFVAGLSLEAAELEKNKQAAAAAAVAASGTVPTSSDINDENSSIRRSRVQIIPKRTEDYSSLPKAEDFQPRSVSSVSDGTASPSDHHGISPASTFSSKTTSTPASSLSSLPPQTQKIHSHTRTYLTTHSPQSPQTYTMLRQSCIRTLITETLPSPLSSGTMIFGDRESGFTIAYVFRVRDQINRGGRRGPYALLCLGGRDERRVMRVLPAVTRVFQSLATKIEGLVDNSAPTVNTDGFAIPTDSTEKGIVAPIENDQPFLRRRRREYETRPKGLDELVGKDDLYIEIHAVFVRLLCVLGRLFGNASE